MPSALLIVRTVLPRAVTIDDQRMIGDGEPLLGCDLTLAFLDGLVVKLLHPATLLADDVVMVVAAVKLEDRLAALEVVPLGKTRIDELGENPVDGRESDLLALLQQRLVDVFRGHVEGLGRFEDLEDLHPRQRNLQPGLANFSVLHPHLRRCILRGDSLSLFRPLETRQQSLHPNMRKLLIFVSALATSVLAGCGTFSENMTSVADVIPNALDRAPFVYKPVIQQGNVVKQEQVDALEPGMSKRQVKFLLGTPMLVDVFHADRWDYAYTRGVGSRPEEIRRLAVFFENDRLVRIAGDMRPRPESERTETKQDVVVTVPDWEEGEKSLWTRTLNAVGVDTEDY